MEKVNQKEVKDPILPILKKMEIGETHSYPLSRMNTVKSVCGQVSVTTGKVFKTKIDRPNLVVTRIE